MKRGMAAPISIVLTSLILGCAQTNSQVTPPLFSSQQTAQERFTEEHREAAELLHEKAVRLEDKVANLKDRVERLNQKPHLDPKELKRQGLKRRMEAYRAEISELYERIAWHNGRADQSNGMLALGKNGLPSHLTSQEAVREWSAEEHLEAADLLDEQLVRLEAKVIHLSDRVERINKKPYLDPKEVKRKEWKALIRANQEEISELREQIIWHHKEADRLLTVPPPDNS